MFRTVIVHHSTFLVNSLAHTLGTRPYTVMVSARDSVVTALLTFGEGYHNFHHRFATDYRNGVRGHQWDPTKWLILGMAGIGWAYDLYRAPREKIVAAELQCEAQRLLERCKGTSEQAMAYVRSRISELSAVVELSAARLGSLERELARVKAAWSVEQRRQLERLRLELRAARREFRQARARWRQAFEELYALPVPQLA
jgi:stearoyl-CoA desaturase (delta-9 desaturase)